MIEKEFVKYEEALALKELGFDEPCLKYWNGIGKYFDQKDWFNWNQSEKFVSIPLYQQAFRWFREKYGLRNSITDFIDDETGIEWDYEIAIIGTDVDEKGNYNPIVDYSTDDETRKFKTYEEAELACLKQLIQIAKNQ